MTNSVQNIFLWAGNDRIVEISVLDGNSSAVPLTGASADWMLTRTPSSSPILRFRSTNTTHSTGGTTQNEIFNSTAGVVRIHLNPPDTISLKGVYFQRLNIIDSISDISTVLTGWVSIHDGQTTV